MFEPVPSSSKSKATWNQIIVIVLVRIHTWNHSMRMGIVG